MRAAAAARSPLAALLAIAVIPILSHLFIVATAEVHLGLRAGPGGLCKLGFVTVSALMHWGIYVSLLAGFALTLRPGHEALITSMARRMHGNIPEEMATYTRKVTIAWCIFFATQLVLSVTLFCFAPLTVWSFFVNILDIPLVVAMFAAEYAVRLRCLRDPPRHSLSMIIEMVAHAIPSKDKQALAEPEP